MWSHSIKQLTLCHITLNHTFMCNCMNINTIRKSYVYILYIPSVFICRQTVLVCAAKMCGAFLVWLSLILKIHILIIKQDKVLSFCGWHFIPCSPPSRFILYLQYVCIFLIVLDYVITIYGNIHFKYTEKKMTWKGLLTVLYNWW